MLIQLKRSTLSEKLEPLGEASPCDVTKSWIVRDKHSQNTTDALFHITAVWQLRWIDGRLQCLTPLQELGTC